MNHAHANFDILRDLSPMERINFLRDHIDVCINLTETGPLREAMSDANIALMRAQDRVNNSPANTNR